MLDKKKLQLHDEKTFLRRIRVPSSAHHHAHHGVCLPCRLEANRVTREIFVIQFDVRLGCDRREIFSTFQLGPLTRGQRSSFYTVLARAALPAAPVSEDH